MHLRKITTLQKSQRQHLHGNGLANMAWGSSHHVLYHMFFTFKVIAKPLGDFGVSIWVSCFGGLKKVCFPTWGIFGFHSDESLGMSPSYKNDFWVSLV